MAETVDQAKARYQAALHAMQSGVAALMAFDASETSPKHLRVGVNSALLGSSAAVHLMIEHGYFTESEYFTKLADLVEADRDDYAARLSEITGSKVNLR